MVCVVTYNAVMLKCFCIIKCSIYLLVIMNQIIWQCIIFEDKEERHESGD